MDTAGSDFASWLRTRRTAAGLSQRGLAERSGIAQPQISAIEAGVRPASSATREALERALRMRPTRLLDLHREEVLDAFARVGASEPRLFGSAARGEDDEESDLDVLVTFPEDFGILQLFALQEELSALLTVDVDLVSSDSEPDFVDAALAQSRPL